MKIFDSIINKVKNNDTQIMTGVGVGEGLILGSYLWYKAGKEVYIILNKEENKNLSFKQKFKLTWKKFIIPVVNTAISGALIITSDIVTYKRYNALGLAYNLAEISMKEFQNKTKELLGEKKTDEIKQEVSKELIANNPNNTVVLSGSSEHLFYEPLTDRYFKSNWTKILAAAADLNIEAASGFSSKITLSDWFYRLGLSKTDISDDLGWDVTEDGLDGKISISVDSKMTEDNVPCGVLRYNNRPKFLR